jgi:hypothetical protein
MSTVNLTEAAFNKVVDREGIVWSTSGPPCPPCGPAPSSKASERFNIVFGKIDTEARRATSRPRPTSSPSPR